VFRHDTVAARLQTLAPNDSLSIVATFNQHLNPYARVPVDSIRVRALPDSTDLPVQAILPKEAYDSAFAARPRADTAGARADSARTPADTVRPVRPTPPAPGRPRPQVEVDTTDRGPLKTRPVLFDRLYIRLGTRLDPGARYVVEVRGVESVSRIVGTTILGFQVPPRPPPADSSRARADSSRARADTTRPPSADSTRPRPRPPGSPR
jgi:hypothetical protein